MSLLLFHLFLHFVTPAPQDSRSYMVAMSDYYATEGAR